MLYGSVCFGGYYVGGDNGMNELLKEITLRVFCAGILCTAAMIIAGEGAAKEPVRICCAALVIIMLVTPLTGDIKNVLRQTDFSADIEDSIDAEMENANNVQYQLVCDKLKSDLQNRLSNAGIDCIVRVDAEIADAEFIINTVYLVGDISDEYAQRAIGILAAEYGVSGDRVIFAKE